MDTIDNLHIVTFIAGRLIVVAMEKPVSNTEERHFDLQVNGAFIGEVSLTAPYLPGISVNNDHLVLWGGTRIYLLSLTEKELQQFGQEDEVHAVYSIGNCWCLVCETSVILWNPTDGIQAQYEHNEVLMNNWWSGDLLIVEDFIGRRLVFRPFVSSTKLMPE